MRSAHSWLVLSLLLVSMTACLPAAPTDAPRTGSAPARTTTRSTASPSPPRPTTTPYPWAAPIDFQRTGGIAGKDDRLTIDTRGHVVLRRGTVEVEFNLGRDELARLIWG